MIMLWFEKLSAALYSSPGIAIVAAFVWGILSVLLSPCHLASIPLIVGFLDGQKDMNTRKAFKLSAFFTLGILLMMAIIGLITGLLGTMLGNIGGWAETVVGVIFLIMAFFIADIFKMPTFLNNGANQKKGKGVWAALTLGFLLGIALGPCSFAFMAPILAIVFSAAGTKLVFALSLVLAYILGHCLVIITAGTFAGAVQVYLHWTSKSKGTKIVRYICGILIFIAGIYLIVKKYI
jgi:cytochrome c-type biogenesis protein